MSRLLVVLAMAILALFSTGTVILDGTARGQALLALGGIGAVELEMGRRRVSVGVYQYRPNRLYYKCITSAL